MAQEAGYRGVCCTRRAGAAGSQEGRARRECPHGHRLVSLASSLPGQAGSDMSLCGIQKACRALGHLSLLWGFQQQAAPDPRGWRFSHGQGCPELCGCGHWEPELLPQEFGLSASWASRPSLAF